MFLMPTPQAVGMNGTPKIAPSSELRMISQLALPNRRYCLAALSALVILWLWVALDRPYNLSSLASWDTYSNQPIFGQPRETMDAFDFPALESESIKSICDATQWNESVVFTCDESPGGVGNVRNSILNCVRYAISAGASLVVPSIVMRSEDISVMRTGIKTDLSYMFDTQHFFDSIQLSCPSLQIYRSKLDIKDFENASDMIPLIPEALVDYIPRTGLAEPQAWRGTFYTWLEQYSTPNVTGPFIVGLDRSYLQYPIYSDGERFALSFGHILKFRSDVRILATKVLHNIGKKHALALNLTQPTLPNAFFGVHLRTEIDSQKAWPTGDWKYSKYSTQAQLYLEQAPRSNPAVVYVASGNLSEVAKFATDVSQMPQNLTTITKFDMLERKERAEVEALTWDQQALVDFLVMLKASDFAGIGHSSFAWNIALKRHVFSTTKEHLDGPQLLSDELSQIYGVVRDFPEYAACLWP
ncbi:hypothetical protein LAWI1_G003874 [Lachnellula willkommii]|uniref:Alternative oxidase n=1 Tax=Lachnellula willkommii TaxID=215461 RepID=A0A559M5Z4_9HELO|nr:hypothetical protein LAWI1_G003874 [Lachnellula willkommii]